MRIVFGDRDSTCLAAMAGSCEGAVGMATAVGDVDVIFRCSCGVDWQVEAHKPASPLGATNPRTRDQSTVEKVSTNTEASTNTEKGIDDTFRQSYKRPLLAFYIVEASTKRCTLLSCELAFA